MSTEPDPRPRLTTGAGTIAGRACTNCDLRTLSGADRCPSCRHPLTSTVFGPGGIVWSSTVVRVPIPGRTPPYTLAYVDLDDGPRVLCHVDGLTDRPPVGQRVRLSGTTADGDLMVEVES